MKRLFLSSLFFLFALFGWAEEVSVEQVRKLAINFMTIQQSQRVNIKDVVQPATDNRNLYVVNFAPQGWALVAANDAVQPIIGYSISGNLSLNALPDNMKYMLTEYDGQIEQIAAKGLARHTLWETAYSVRTRAVSQKIEPLIQVNWNQSAPYNVYCPKGEALVGCVAVAMSQAMSVQRYPASPKGKVSFTAPNYGGLSIDFDEERAYNWDDILSGANNEDETARLLYHAGMSVRMDYGSDGSGIPSNEVNRISDALRTNFSYPEEVGYFWRDYYDGDWEQLLMNELSAGRAIVYNAVDSKANAGHSFNLDGNDGEGRFHLNWGWGGTGNGYFTISNLRDKMMGMDYDIMHVAIIGIGASDQVLKSISLSNNRIEEGLPAGSIVGAVLVNGETPKGTYMLRVQGTYNSATATNKVVPFVIEGNMLKTTETLNANTSRWELEITVQDSESDTSLTQGFCVTVSPWQSIEETTSIVYDRNTRNFMLTTKHNVNYTISNEAGQLVKQGSLEPLPELIIRTDELPAGVNTVELKCADEVKSFKIVTH